MSFADTLRTWQESLQDFDINDLDFENIGSWPTPIKAVTWVLVFAIVVFGLYKYDISDLQKQLNSVQTKESQLKDEFKKKAFEAANLVAYREQMKEMEQSFSALVGQLPNDTEVPGLLEDITNKGVGNGLEFQSIELRPEKKTEVYVELPINIIAEGTYHDLGAFISGVAGLPRIVTLHDFKITPVPDSSALEMQILAKTYRYSEEEDEPKPVPKKSKKKNKKGRK